MKQFFAVAFAIACGIIMGIVTKNPLVPLAVVTGFASLDHIVNQD